MGLEANCIGSFNGQVSEGKAQLESEKLVFRGEFRVAIAIAAIECLSVRDGKMSIAFDKGTLILHLGTAAAKWEEKIKNPKSLLDKLGIKPGMKVGLFGFQSNEFQKEVSRKGATVSIKPAKNSDMIFLQADSKKELQSISSVSKNLATNGSLWVVYPKGKEEIKQEDIFKAGKSAHLVDVKVVSFSSTHTALKFVIPVTKRI